MGSYENAKVAAVVSCIEQISTGMSDLKVEAHEKSTDINFLVKILDIYGKGMQVLRLVLRAADEIYICGAPDGDNDRMRIHIRIKNE